MKFDVSYQSCPYWSKKMAMRGEEELELEDRCELGHLCQKAYGEPCPELEEMEKEDA